MDTHVNPFAKAESTHLDQAVINPFEIDKTTTPISTTTTNNARKKTQVSNSASRFSFNWNCCTIAKVLVLLLVLLIAVIVLSLSSHRKTAQGGRSADIETHIVPISKTSPTKSPSRLRRTRPPSFYMPDASHGNKHLIHQPTFFPTLAPESSDNSAPLPAKTNDTSTSDTPPVVILPKNLAGYVKTRWFAGVGDSFTVGKVVKGGHKTAHPYTIALKSFFSNSTIIKDYGQHYESSFKVMKRISSVLLTIKSQNLLNVGGVVAIFVGYSDLKMSNPKPVNQILQNIANSHKECHSVSSDINTFVFTIAVTLPMAKNLTTEQDTLRLNINKGLRSFQANCSSRVVLLDLENVYNPTFLGNDKYWSEDYIHFSAIGYDGIGTRMFASLLKFKIDESLPISESNCNYDMKSVVLL